MRRESPRNSSATWAAHSVTASSRAKPPACSRTSRSIAAGRARCRRSTSTSRSTSRGRSTRDAARGGPARPYSWLRPGTRSGSRRAIRDLAPKFAQLTKDVVFDDLWRRSDLSRRDRSLVTISIPDRHGQNRAARRSPGPGPRQRRPTHGRPPGFVAHLAIYCGWPSAVSALEVYEQVFTARKIDVGTLRLSSGERLPVPSRTSHAPKP